ncbi:MAG TPA: DUF6624 domain-containing protein [Bacteroidota bacterium]|nr:DUF6624 domain-containing protein [Bacteroidota bacterium]
MKIKTILCLTVCISSIVFAQTVKDSLLRAELLDHLKADQDVRQTHFIDKLQRGIQPGFEDVLALNKVDSADIFWMKHYVIPRGWPGISLVGKDGEEAAFLLVQHADLDTAFQSYCLKLLKKAYNEGETSAEHLAYLVDRLEVAAGRPQIYGSQSFVKDGQVIFRPIRDSSTVDERRARLGLMPLGEYKNLLDSMFTPRGNPK